ncbi:MAG: hypothetical protein QNK37_07605 [Acidobacteriota bacterium]|nr:hypothetical protein [Acidobacteriota bacterium]
MFYRLLLLCFATTSLWADVQIQTVIVDAYHLGNSEQLGVSSFTITGDDFASADEENPVYIRLNLEKGARLTTTLVDQGRTDSLVQPVYLPLWINRNDPGAVQMAAPGETLSIVRWVSGESNVWLRITTPTSVWLREGDNVFAPSGDVPVSFTLGESARGVWENLRDLPLDIRNLPFSTRNPQTQGPTEDAVSTLMCIDLSEGDLAITGLDSLLAFNLTDYDAGVDLGGGVYSAQEGQALNTIFTGDARVARGRDRHIETVITEPAPVGRHQVIDQLSAVNNILSFDLNNSNSSEILDTHWWNGSTIQLQAVGGALFREDSVRLLSSQACGHLGTIVPDEATLVTFNEQNYYSRLDLVWNGGVLTTSDLGLDLDITLFMVPGQVVDTEWYVTYSVEIAYSDPNQNTTEGEVIFSGGEQAENCAAGTLQLVEGNWWFANLTYDRFVPHLTRAGGDFFTVLRFHNTGESVRTVNLLLQDQEGALIQINSIALNAGETLDRPVEEILGGELASHALINGDPSVKVTAIYQALREDASPVHINSTDQEALRWRLIAGDRKLTYDGLAVVNRGQATSPVIGRHLDAAGNQVSEIILSETLKAGEKELYVLSDLFTAQPGDIFEILTFEPVALVALRGNLNSSYIWENRAQPVE